MKHITQDEIDELRAEYRRDRDTLVAEYQRARADLSRQSQTSAPWLPQALQDASGRSWRQLSDRKVPWASVCTSGETPAEVLDAMCAMLAVSLLSPRDLARLNPNAEF